MKNNTEHGFDWEEAAAAMENISLLEDETRIKRVANPLKEIPCQNFCNIQQNVAVKPPSHAKLQQKTMLSFVQTSNQQPMCPKRINQPPGNGSELNSEDMFDTGRLQIDLEAARTWVYPVNVPMRDYQYSIVQIALFSNTLVSLPTGLGKTLIAAVVMYNFFRWFPTGKIVFSAPSRPLVLQQIEACHDSVGIPQEYTIDMTGQMNPSQRSTLWQTKRVFFVTPQVLEKDIQSGSCPMQDLVCLVVDEAHRAMGNYAYCIVVRKLMEVSVRLRILALTATPGSKQVTVQSVIDNLRISCLEYRNEYDSDVKQFVHDRKLELLQVPMDSESSKIKDLLVEVLQPLVNRLCGFNVFYSKDAARLTPYEFLMAREKFRQAPPSFLDPRQYGEVEACFGATISLCHVVKLLVSHGIQPAFEMLKKKLQSGPFGRLMGRNEKLQDIKLLMQKYLSKGASSPKLTKMLELIADHFELKDPGKTRVIIFTNFRESVKDILEALRILGDIVKATEFVGQSSGASLKGQSQKVQQMVLQKFRMGGFNTIVATSIAEEGLDIMEVDLVICFDANVSPLRMVQRMGRTGRKRDGRVIILASEGAEVQGYLKKQAKSKVLLKHLHNGGVHSFNFHSSPRMVPHSIKPEPQLVELAITKFVPRVKSKLKAAQVPDPVIADLSAEESLLLKKYTSQLKGPVEDRWRPSLIAFPHCQLLPTQVHYLKHSERTISMLIDTLQSLHENNTRTCKVTRKTGDINSVNNGLEDPDCNKDSDHGSSIPTVLPMQIFQVPRSPDKMASHTNEVLESTRVASFYSPPSVGRDDSMLAYACQPHSLAAAFGTTWEAESSVVDNPLLPCQDPSDADTIGNRSPRSLPSVEVLRMEDHSKSPNELGRINILDSIRVRVPPLPQQCSKNCANGDDLPSLIGKPNPLGPSEDNPYTQGIVSINALGYVQISSPPKLPFESIISKLLDIEVPTICLSDSSSPKDPEMAEVRRDFDSFEEKQLMESAVGNTTARRACFESLILTSTKANACNFTASTPEHEISTGSLQEEYANNVEINMEDDSPRLCTLAEQGLVPMSPGLESIASDPVGQSMDRIECLASNVERVCSSPQMERNTQTLTLHGATPTSVSKECESFGKHETKHNKQTIDLDLIQSVSAVQISDGKNEAEKYKVNLEMPAIQLSDGSNWNHPLQASCSAQKPKKFRRLRKAKEASRHVSQRSQPSANLDRRLGDEKLCAADEIHKSARKQKLHFGAALLVDEEAEVSSGEEVSADEEEEDEQGSLQDFINDQVEPTEGASDMMAIYRKSLLTPSPLDERSLPWMRRLVQCRTPRSGDSNYTISDGTESIQSPPSDSHRKMQQPCTGNNNNNNNKATLTICDSQPKGPQRMQEDLLEQHSTSKAQERKRKLSFEQEQTIASMFCGNLDDDLFAGLDLDALEVEAVQKSRANPQLAAQARPAAVAGNQDSDLCKMHDDENLDFCPSFNLGIDF